MNRRYKKEVESSCEYILPDYMGDIKKILSSRAECIPAGRFLTDSGVEITGAIEYEILYADSENKLTAITSSSDYSVSIPTDAAVYVDCAQHSRVSSMNIRITGPRKISMKFGVETSATVTSSASCEVAGDAFSSDREPEHTTRVINTENSIYGKSVEREYAEEGERMRDVAAEDVEIISSSGRVRVFETRAVDGGVEIKGELVIVAIVRTPEQPPFSIRRTIPFEERVEIDGVTKDMQVVADGCVTSAVCGVGEDGEETVITVNAIVEFEAYAVENESVSVITDAYLLDAETVNEYADLEYTTLGSCQINELTISDKISREAIGCADARDILVMYADVRSASAENLGNAVEYKGEIAISGVACEINVDSTVTYVPIKMSRPFVQNVNLNCQNYANSIIDYSIQPVLCEGSFDADDMYVKCILKVKTKLSAPSKITRLATCSVGGDAEIMASASRITVYYPSADDTLFSVAKRFHTTAAKLCCDNSIEATASTHDAPDSLSGVKKLLIR